MAKRRQARISALKSQKGASLIELMVALLVMSIGVLGVLAMQINSLRLSQNSYLYSQAGILANDIYEAMYATSEDNRVLYAAIDGSSSACSPTCDDEEDMVSWHMYTWNQNISNLLPQGEGSITRNDDDYIIEISFVQRATTEAGISDTAATARYTMRVSF